ncbi:hypothetical protein FHW67_001359 [Herbaspirillum sp. Sphag1AN]|uniref:hypothetical protein n=1 Tax=unclassified Herbaspirillum TaxID=2624150 RepID=UPI001616FA08|nr:MULTISPECIES: hypothetical protein [unclassified Herbaspirillum]MBB3212091.1 hypothetical protein [Herbaspirillum sp. Sphag1AN]MBB3244075.1 hypothetical protein [Herbaspirillum sp. Sphag64]
MTDHDSSFASTSHTDKNSTSTAPTHQDFHWIEGPQQGTLYGNFLETALDVSAGIHACLQIIYASELESAANDDADEGEAAAPAIGIVYADQLKRLSIASASLLRDEARRHVEMCNEAE